jgi:DNA polymerase-3 subunit delta
MPAALRSFASTDRFLSEISSPATLRPGYVLLGDEAFLYQRSPRRSTATSRLATSISRTLPSSMSSIARRRHR